jgi:hypothetical protein
MLQGKCFHVVLMQPMPIKKNEDMGFVPNITIQIIVHKKLLENAQGRLYGQLFKEMLYFLITMYKKGRI